MGQTALKDVEPFGLASIPLPVLLGVLRSMGDRLHEGLYVLDAEDRVQYANPVAQRLFGAQRESQVRGRDVGNLIRPVRDEVDDRRHNILDEHGSTAARLGVIVRAGRRPASAQPRSSSTPSVSAAPFAIHEVETLELNGESLGCVVVRLVSDAALEHIDAVARDLCHLVSRVTRPEDMIVRIAPESVALFAHVDSLAGVKSIAERLTARGRREIQEEFRVGIAMGSAGATAETLARDAQVADYTTKPWMRGRVTVRRSGPA